MRHIIICVLAFAALTLAEDELAAFNSANRHFTAKMCSEVMKAKPDQSVVLSAFSVLSPLAQLSLAAVGESHDQILSVIGFKNDNITKAVFPVINNELRSVKGVEFRTASKIYIPIGDELNENFAAVSKTVFDSEIKNVDFGDSVGTAKEINEWVEDQTNHRIKDLVNADSLGPATKALLVNAIYFKGSWKSKFNKEITTDRDFHVTKEKSVKVPTMFKRAHYLYGESEELGVKLLEIPYEGDESSFLIVLPNEIDGLPALEEKLKNTSDLDKAFKKMKSVDVNLHLPRFKIETTINLIETLDSIGIKDIFDPEKARLENLLKSSKSLSVSEAIQKAFIEVNEEGAEAAAANEFVVNRIDSEDLIVHDFDANRPFAFILKAKSEILFCGVFLS